MTMRTLFVILLLISLNSFAKKNLYSSPELGFFVGEAYYLGDLNKKHFVPYNPGAGVYFRYNFNQRFALRVGYNYGQIEGSDANSSSSFNKFRNFGFKSTLNEVNLLGEFNFFDFSPFDPNAYIVSPYGFIGLAYLNHNPRGFFKGDYITAQDLQTEGVRYSKHIVTMPMGIGLKISFGRVGLGLEWGIRKTWTDYLDDVSSYFQDQSQLRTVPQQQVGNSTSLDDASNLQRGDLYSKDWYVFTGINLFVNLRPKRVCRSFN